MPNNRIDDLLNMGSESEARMLGVEGERTAWPSSRHTSTGNIPRGMSMNEYWEVFPEEKPRLMKAAEGYVDFFDPNPAAKGVLDFMDSYEDLKGETEATAEGMLERAKQLRTLSTEEAQSLIVNGFCKDVFKQLPFEFAVEATRLLELNLEGAVG